MELKRCVGHYSSILVLILLSISSSIAQELVKRDFKVIFSDHVLKELSPYKEGYFDVREMNHIRQEISDKAYALGYLAINFQIDSTRNPIELRVRLGASYSWLNFRTDDRTAYLMRRAGVSPENLAKKPINPKTLATVSSKLITDLELKGFPFANFYLDSVVIRDANVDALAIVDPGPLVKIDSLKIIGSLIIKEYVIANYLGLKEGNPYSEKRVAAISSSLKDLPYLTESRPFEIHFYNQNTKLTLFLAEKRASSFDGIIGFLPDAKTGKILFTGDVALQLENNLGRGESILFNWRKLQTNTQDLTAKVILPYIFKSQYSTDFFVKLYKRDTLFTDQFGQFGLRYNFSRNNFIRVFIDRQTSNLISTRQYENFKTPPPYLDRNITSYGFGLYYKKWDYALNPSKGIEILMEGAAGNKIIKKNHRLSEVIYDSLNLKSLQIKSKIDLAYALPIVKRLVWFQNLIGAALVNNQLLNNEAYRIGGFRTLRGFNEESIYTSTNAICRNEIRYQMEKDGYAFLFSDIAWYENASVNRVGPKRDIPFSFGAGTAFATKAGLFRLSYALGKQQANPILLKAGKIHFGYLAVF